MIVQIRVSSPARQPFFCRLAEYTDPNHGTQSHSQTGPPLSFGSRRRLHMLTLVLQLLFFVWHAMAQTPLFHTDSTLPTGLPTICTAFDYLWVIEENLQCFFTDYHLFCIIIINYEIVVYSIFFSSQLLTICLFLLSSK
jgi:hypothetical protein